MISENVFIMTSKEGIFMLNIVLLLVLILFVLAGYFIVNKIVIFIKENKRENEKNAKEGSVHDLRDQP